MTKSSWSMGGAPSVHCSCMQLPESVATSATLAKRLASVMRLSPRGALTLGQPRRVPACGLKKARAPRGQGPVVGPGVFSAPLTILSCLTSDQVAQQLDGLQEYCFKLEADSQHLILQHLQGATWAKQLPHVHNLVTLPAWRMFAETCAVLKLWYQLGCTY
jgi:hypothetical protein